MKFIMEEKIIRPTTKPEAIKGKAPKLVAHLTAQAESIDPVRKATLRPLGQRSDQ